MRIKDYKVYYRHKSYRIGWWGKWFFHWFKEEDHAIQTNFALKIYTSYSREEACNKRRVLMDEQFKELAYYTAKWQEVGCAK